MHLAAGPQTAEMRSVLRLTGEPSATPCTSCAPTWLTRETGTFVVSTNEGNADLSANVPKLHIASTGLEKIIPCLEHLAVLVRVLSRICRAAGCAPRDRSDGAGTRALLLLRQS
jgi:LUD domain